MVILTTEGTKNISLDLRKSLGLKCWVPKCTEYIFVYVSWCTYWYSVVVSPLLAGKHLTLSHIQTLYDAFAADDIVFSTLFNKNTFIKRDFPYFCLDDFKVFCCRFVGCWKVLRISLLCYLSFISQSVIHRLT